MPLGVFHRLKRLYEPSLAGWLVAAYRSHDSSIRKYLHWFWHSKTFRVPQKGYVADKPTVQLLLSIMLAQIVAGAILLADWVRTGTAGEWAFGLAILVAYPLVTAHLFALAIVGTRLVSYIVQPKKLGKALLAQLLEQQVRELRRKHRFIVVAVAGSIGKTTTKLAIAELLGQSLRVRYQAGNYNDRLTVPLIFFGHAQPSLWNVFAWARIIGENTASIEHAYPHDVVVVEIGTDGPGQMRHFAYLKPDITVLTAVTPEHMVNLKTLDGVAAEELEIFTYSKKVLLGGDDMPGKYLVGREFLEYSTTTNVAHNYFARASHQSLKGQTLWFEFPRGNTELTTSVVGDQGAKSVLAAAAVADILGLNKIAIKQGVEAIAAPPGRMQILSGTKQCTIIDDTYNATPEPVKAALDVLYAARAPQRIALLGSMNELGSYAREAHEIVGAYCDPSKLDLVVTVGRDARRWLAPQAKARGCQVHSFDNPHAAGAFVRKRLKTKAVILVKGSQNGVFTEEAVKLLLAHPADAKKLVRQSKQWMRVKQKQFGDDTL